MGVGVGGWGGVSDGQRETNRWGRGLEKKGELVPVDYDWAEHFLVLD